MKRQKLFGILPVLFTVALFFTWGQGCKGKLPATSVMAVPTALVAATPTPQPCSFLFQDCESLTQNGTITKNDTSVSVSISPYNTTQGSHSLKLNLSNGGRQNLINITSFYPNRWPNVSQVVMDVTADASLIVGSYSQLQLVGTSTSGAIANYWSPLTADVGLVAGSQSVTFDVDWSQGTLLKTDTIDNLILVWNPSGAGTGNLYIDNIRLVSPPTHCIPPLPTTCSLLSGFESPFENGVLTSVTNQTTLSYSPLHATQGTNALQVLLNPGGGCKLFAWAGFFPNRWPDATQIVLDIYVDPSIIGAGYNELAWAAEGTGTYWNVLTSYKPVVAGAQSVTFDIDWSLGTMNPATATVTKLYLNWNAGGTGTGTFSIDDVRLLNSPTCNP